jgi:hypothetical protein
MKRFALKGRKLTWINPTHIARRNEFRSIFVGENDVSQDKGGELKRGRRLTNSISLKQSSTWLTNLLLGRTEF